MTTNETTTVSVEETEPAENAENTKKLGNTIMVSEISIFTLWVENLQFNCDQCNKTMKIHTMKNPYHCPLCAKKSISSSQMKSHARGNLNPYALCGREVKSRNH